MRTRGYVCLSGLMGRLGPWTVSPRFATIAESYQGIPANSKNFRNTTWYLVYIIVGMGVGVRIWLANNIGFIAPVHLKSSNTQVTCKGVKRQYGKLCLAKNVCTALISSCKAFRREQAQRSLLFLSESRQTEWGDSLEVKTAITVVYE